MSNFMSDTNATTVLTEYAGAIKARALDFVEIDYEDWLELTDEEKEEHNWKVMNVPDVGPTPPEPDVPDGKTVTPVNDAEIWLACAGLTDTGYTSLSEVLSDTSILQTVLADDNASDYLARCSSFVLDVTSDQTAMSYIGLNNYTANALLDDQTWNDAICDSTYYESVLNVKVPVMTSNTAPYGTVIFDNEQRGSGYQAFNNNSSNYWGTQTGGAHYIGYDFVEPVRIVKIFMMNRNDPTAPSDSNICAPKNISLEGSSDNTQWTSISSFVNSKSSSGQTNYFKTINLSTFRYNRLYISSTYNNDGQAILAQLQFWGRKDVV